MSKAINKYPDMSSSIIDYSDPSDLPEIFFKREWSWFQQIFSKLGMSGEKICNYE